MSKLRALVLGSSGIIGSHLRITSHPHILATYHRGREAVDLSDESAVFRLLAEVKPNVIINLAGESRPDVVEAAPQRYIAINQHLPHWLAAWSFQHKRHLIHISSQAVYRGAQPPYGPTRTGCPVSAYGEQKLAADSLLQTEYGSTSTILRPTFVLGVRPDPTVGRQNPVEAMLGGQRQQVSDRWFSPSFAPDVAAEIWHIAVGGPRSTVLHLGVPITTNRFEIARSLGCDVVPVSHDDFPGIAPRPIDTSYAAGSRYRMKFAEGIADCLRRWELQQRTVAA